MNDLLNSFPKANKQQWTKVAAKELGDENPFESLRWTVDAGIQANPYYDQSDLLSTKAPFALKPSNNILFGPRAWYNMPKIIVGDHSDANKLALNLLQNGADGIVFDLSAVSNFALEELLAGIQWEYCPLGFIVGSRSAKFSEVLFEYVNDKNLPKEKLEGFLIWDKLPASVDPQVSLFQEMIKFRAFTLEVVPGTTIEELVSAISTGASFLQSVNEEILKTVGNQLGFSIQLDARFFLQIAKLKSLHYLWSTILRAFNLEANGFIHATSSAWAKEDFQPHGNMIKSTTSAMAAICGGCDALTVEPEDSSDITMSRIAKNVSSILREESYLDKVADPTVGSYFVESLVNDLSSKAWELFNEKMKNHEA